MTMRTAGSAGAVMLAALVTACAGDLRPSFPLPDEPGLYAVTHGDELLRLDGDREWEVESWPTRSALGPYTEFVIFDPDLARDARSRDRLVDLWRVAWVRSEVDSRGLAGPVQGSTWAVAPLEPFRVSITPGQAEGYPEYIHVVPERPLEPGLYALRLTKVGTSRAGRLGVDWTAVDKQDYSAVNCVDRYLDAVPPYRTCTGGGGVMESSTVEGLQITLVDPLRRDNVLVVQGVVVNTTSDTKTVPTMRAVLLDKTGRQLTDALIEPKQVELRPGERMSFKTEVVDAPQETARIDVDFAPMAANARM